MAPIPTSRPPMAELPPIIGKKRPADSKPSLLPAFEPTSSSPQLPRPTKRLRASSTDRISLTKQSPSKQSNALCKYPTPVPTSSTGIMSSSPPQIKTRRPLQRTASTLSNRAPLASVPALELDVTGLPTLMGRSGRVSHYQLSTNKYISRVHVTAAYITGERERNDRVEIVCLGWNGVKVHCQGQAWDLEKNDTFTSESKDADIMVDVHGTRVLLRWPVNGRKAVTPSESEFSQESPSRINVGLPLSPFSSPIRHRPIQQALISSPPHFGDTEGQENIIKIYEDEEEDKENALPNSAIEPTQSTAIMSQVLCSLHEEAEEAEEEFSDQDEENEPLVHEMGPFGNNLLPRMASCSTDSIKVDTTVKQSEQPAKKKLSVEDQSDPVLNHVLNQLAYSRLSSTPLSILLNNLPSDLRGDDQVKLSDLKLLIEHTACVGEVCRAGKDAAGKPLESEYYYIPEQDFDAARRDAVVEGLRKPGLRNCRKQHKQYYWRKPK